VPSDSTKAALVELALLGTDRTQSGAAISLRDQFLDLIQSQSVSPRITARTAPIAVADVDIPASALNKNGAYICDPAAVSSWSNELASSFTRYIATNTGLAIRPYLPGGGDEIKLTPILVAAAEQGLELGDSSVLYASLQKPSEIFHISITSLISKDVKPEDPNLAEIIYGFKIRLSVEPYAKSLESDKSLVWDFTVPDLSNSIPKTLNNKYLDITTVKVLRDALNLPDFIHSYWWRESIEWGLFQISREMFFDSEDQAKRFQGLRSHLYQLGVFNIPTTL
jgi:hypothetical protein